MNPLQQLQPISDQFSALERQQVKLTFYAPAASLVQVGGDFNGWRPATQPLEYVGFGEWAIRLTLNAGQYEYRFLVDGTWMIDPQAAKSPSNSFGEHNSLLRVA